ncbi:gliding motility lipoprotein GldB [Cytophagaceae bacterium ABcell3]|nr:gliding motility lipoprotein GldB [Cytophagaceae bacterium ABcell3]
MKYTGNFFTLIILLLISCKPDKSNKVIDEAENLSVNVQIERLEKQFFEAQSPEDIANIFSERPGLAAGYFQIKTPQDADKEYFKQTFNHFSNKHLNEFYQYTLNEYEDFSKVEEQLERLFKYISYYYPDYEIPTINTVVTGFRFDKDMHFSDSLIVISLDYFLDKNAPFRPAFYEYILERYQKPYLVPMIGMGISSKFNKSNLKDESLLAHMIYYGKAHYFMEHVIPGIPDSLNIMYSSQELKDITENEDIIWAHFVNNKLLFDQSPKLREKYLGESPRINEIGEKCPGRIGRWIGWQIVKKYMEKNPDVTLQQLMEEQDAQKIFKLSKYKPRT